MLFFFIEKIFFLHIKLAIKPFITTIRNEVSEGNLEKNAIANLIALNALLLEYANALSSFGNLDTLSLYFCVIFSSFYTN